MSDNTLRLKADTLKRELKHTKVLPQRYVEFYEDEKSFQGLGIKACGDVDSPIRLEINKPVILDFGRHCVGYFNYKLSYSNPIVDSPVNIKFEFGEFPYEIVKDEADYQGTLGKGWLQKESRTAVFCPVDVTLERRYSFRYVRITRTANDCSEIFLTDVFADCVSAVDVNDAKKFDIPDPTLKKIYDISLETLKECEQDVFEDGPKRDRRLWIGDLRLQAMSDYVSFRNLDLIKRCIYLFAAHRMDDKLVAPCVFPDSPPYVDDWYFGDYSLYFVSCLYDYTKNTDDLKLVQELYDIAKDQIDFMKSVYARENWQDNPDLFVDWCPDLDKTVAGLGIYMYVLNQFMELSQILGKDCDEAGSEYEKMKERLCGFYSDESGLFIAASGQISWHSQIWAILSGALSHEQGKLILKNINSSDTVYTIRTPYMVHYYIEALYKLGEKEYALNFIKDYWSAIISCGYDCCPEVYNSENDLESPYNAPEINSACHAWSCTPVYWIHKYYTEED